MAPYKNVPPSHGFLSLEAWPHHREQFHCFDVYNHSGDHQSAPKISGRFQILTRQVGKWRHHRCGGELLPLTVTNNWYREHRPNPQPLLHWISPLGFACRSLAVRGRLLKVLLSQDADPHPRNPGVITDSPYAAFRAPVGEALLCEQMMSFVIYGCTLRVWFSVKDPSQLQQRARCSCRHTWPHVMTDAWLKQPDVRVLSGRDFSIRSGQFSLPQLSLKPW